MINYAEYMAEMLRCGWSLNVYGPATFLCIVDAFVNKHNKMY